MPWRHRSYVNEQLLSTLRSDNTCGRNICPLAFLKTLQSDDSGSEAWLPDGYSQIFRSYVLGPSNFWTMAPLRYAAKFDPFLSLDCAPTPSTLAQSKERKGSNFAIWQPFRQEHRSAAWAGTRVPRAGRLHRLRHDGTHRNLPGRQGQPGRRCSNQYWLERVQLVRLVPDLGFL